MKVKVLAASPDSMRLLLEETEPAYANALRRVLVAEVPKMAIEDVEFHLGPIRAEDGKEYESVSPLFDEIIAHRLGLIPIPTDLSLYNRREDCPSCHGEGCPSCTIIYSVNKRGPGLVTSADLEPIGDAKLRPTDQKVPIVKLGDGQAMLIYATAVLGSGKDHAKWQATHGVGYRYYPTLKAGSKALDPLDPEVPFCESHMVSTNTDEEEVLPLGDDATCKKFMDLYKVESVKAGSDPTRIVMEFETDGSMTTKAVLLAGLDILSKRFAELAGQAAGIE
ncbi:MAG TPA: DNA-directed RNA polymerase subunit D [Thermoplasmata archaeon]|jgi:DNA-directed RNA polymerase subunit D|nr:DNA-directed RNA polymerase subunit D [Thermoplasmata archaeon]